MDISSGWRAGVVSSDPLREGVEVAVGRPGNDRSQVVVSIGRGDMTFETIDPMERLPTIFIPDAIAKPLLDALAAHYGGTGDTRVLRRDYEAERARVDRLIGGLLKAGG